MKDKSKIWVIGGANIDVCGTSLEKLRDYDSNIGNIELRYGGVGRNIAQTAALLGAKVNFISCFSDDHYGKLLMEDCVSLGMDISYSVASDKYPTSMYLAILDSDGDMRMAMSDMRIMEELDFRTLDRVLSDIDKNDILVLDTNFSEEYLKYMTEKKSSIIAMDPVSISKIGRIGSVIDKIDIFKPNHFEANALNGIKITDEKTAKDSLRWFLSRGIKEIIITMAEKGVLLGIAEGNSPDKLLWMRHRKLELENANGGGDAFLGAYLSKRTEGTSPVDSAKFAISAATAVIEANEFKCNKLRKEDIEQRIGSLEIKETLL